MIDLDLLTRSPEVVSVPSALTVISVMQTIITQGSPLQLKEDAL